MQSVTSSTTTMVNSIPQTSPPAVSSQSSSDSTNSDLPAISSPDQSRPSTIITNAFAAAPLPLSSSTSVTSTASSALFAKVNVSNSLGDSTTSHGPLIMSAPTQNEVGWLCWFEPSIKLNCDKKSQIFRFISFRNLLYFFTVLAGACIVQKA